MSAPYGPRVFSLPYDASVNASASACEGSGDVGGEGGEACGGVRHGGDARWCLRSFVSSWAKDKQESCASVNENARKRPMPVTHVRGKDE